METEESVLKDAISADIKSFNSFNPVDAESMVAFHGGIDGSQSLFDFIKQFDAQFTINSEIEDYYKEFMKCIEKGMTYCAFSIRLHEQTPELYAKIKITI